MKKRIILFTLSLLLSACTPPQENPAPAEELPEKRKAVFVEIENNIEARASAEDQLRPAEIGQKLFPGGNAQSGEDSRARLDLVPEGTIIRLAPNSDFTLEVFKNNDNTPYTRLKLVTGQIWIILFGGELDVDTAYGTATVRGSMMSVSFGEDGMRVTCLEGHCALENNTGRVELKEGFASVISAEGQPPATPGPIDKSDVDQWQQANPEIEPWLKGTPIPKPTQNSTPEPNPEEKSDDGKGSEISPIIYNIENNCDPDSGLVWIWEFVGPVTVNFTLNPGESESGQLPPGEYMVTDTLVGESTNGPALVRGGTIDLKSCDEK